MWCSAKRVGRVSASVILLSLLACAQSVSAQHQAAQTRAAMHDLYSSFRTLLPFSVEPARAADHPARGRINAAMRTMEMSAAALESHALGFDPGRRALAHTLAEDLAIARRDFERGHLDRSAALLKRAAGACIDCHSRIASASDSSFAAGLLDDVDLAKLNTDTHAQLLIATRRFNDALSLLESVLGSNDAQATELARPLERYLTICIRVKHDLERPVATLRRFAKRRDLWTQLRANVQAWLAALKHFAAHSSDAKDLARGRELLDEARRAGDYPADRRAFVHYLMASATLNEIVAAERAPNRDQAHAYYLLGTTELWLDASYWSTPADYYLEQAIRMAPQSEIAKRAFELLESETIFAYSGSGGTNLPADVRRRLDELRRIAASHPGG